MEIPPISVSQVLELKEYIICFVLFFFLNNLLSPNGIVCMYAHEYRASTVATYQQPQPLKKNYHSVVEQPSVTNQ